MFLNRKVTGLCQYWRSLYITFVIIAIREKRSNYRYETVKIDQQMYWDPAIKFAKWQHPAKGRGAKFAVTGTTYLNLKI